jgi:glycosyltransferase involved in cell wall biosynthesis
VQDRFGIYMSQEVQAHAELLLVHSRYAADVLRMDRLPGAAAAETELVGRGIPEVAVRRNGGGPSSGPRVVSHAAGEDAEAIDLLLHAFAEIARERHRAGLVLLGELEPSAKRRLVETASNLGLSQAVHLAGPLSGDEYWRAVASGDIAVELRTGSDGEASASVCDCLATRVPTVVSSVGWLAELPDSPAALAATISRVLDEPELRRRIRTAQDSYAAANSYGRVAERYAEILGL